MGGAALAGWVVCDWRHCLVPILVLGYYWTALSFAGLRLCTLMARIGPVAVMPTTRRLRRALLLIGTGLTLAACQNLAATMHTALHAGTLTLSCGLAILAAAAITTGRDLRYTHRQTT